MSKELEALERYHNLDVLKEMATPFDVVSSYCVSGVSEKREKTLVFDVKTLLLSRKIVYSCSV